MTTRAARTRFRTFRGFRLAQRATILHSGKVDVSRLTCRAAADAKTDALCGEPARWLLTAACPHEHVVPSLGCDAHAEDARTRVITCTECRISREPHSCPVAVEFVALTPRRTP